MTEEILTGEEARKKLKEGIDKVANPVILSLGAKGKNIVLGGGRNNISKDGFSIAKSISLSDPGLSIGAELVKKVSKKTVEEAGDGTTTSCLLAQAIVSEGFKLLSAGHNGTELRKGIENAVNIVVEELKGMATPVELGSPMLKNIATISGNNDAEIGENVTQAFLKTGKDGVISLDDSKNSKTYIDVKEGMILSRGYHSPLFVNDQEKLSCQLDKCLILLSDEKISTLKEIKPIFEEISKKLVTNEFKSILIIAPDFEGEAEYTIIANKLKQNMPVCLVKTPGFGDNQKDVMQDIAAVVGANVANDAVGLRVDTLKFTDLGTAEKVLVTKEETAIVGGGGKKFDIEERIRYVRTAIEKCDANDVYGKKLMEERLAKLTGGVAVIYVGAPTDTELNELKDRYDDAVRATRCALDEGVLVGGGISLIRCIDKLNNVVSDTTDETAGVKLIQKILEAPFVQMAKNADLDSRVTISDVLKTEGNTGYNFKTDKWEDLVLAGVVDPLKVVRVSLINAASFAGTLLTTEAVIVPEKEDLKQFIPPQLRQ